MTHPDYPLEAEADLPGVSHAAMRQMILAQASAAKMPVLEDADDRLTVCTAHGLIGLRPGRATATAGMVAAEDPRWLFVMKNAVVAQMRAALPAVAEAMRWSDGDAVGGLPPNFMFVRVRSVEPLGPIFLRVTLEGEDMSAHGDRAIHFRLVLPPAEDQPVWPSVAANGSIVWPEGPGAPHRPVYTTRAVDHVANTLVTDVFVHEGGRTTAWARDVMDGARGRTVIGVVGPSGGGLLAAERVLLAADETGFPAAARLLENLQSTARGLVLLEADDGADCAYPIDAPEGVEIRWLVRSRGEVLADAALAALPDFSDAKIWFAGEREDAARVREAARSAGRESGDLRISGFWRARGS
ncbi:MAG: siderophore-interacting protein [Pseudomonadota bacterium]